MTKAEQRTFDRICYEHSEYGLTYAEIGRQMGVNPRRVSRAVKRHWLRERPWSKQHTPNGRM